MNKIRKDGPLFQLLLSLRLEGQKNMRTILDPAVVGKEGGVVGGVGNELMQEMDPTVHQAH